MREYELTVLLHPDLEIDLEKPLAKVRKIVTNNGGTITNEDNWGKRRLAYRIGGESFAVYVLMEVQLPAEGVRKVDSTLNITDEVMRHLLVSVDPKEKAALADQEKRKERDNDESEE